MEFTDRKWQQAKHALFYTQLWWNTKNAYKQLRKTRLVKRTKLILKAPAVQMISGSPSSPCPY
uniref:Uncharacterized protein n=1 Tax=Anguilla anguilla TaxID=7936 RepID=A0A0E9XTA4_ANGAN